MTAIHALPLTVRLSLVVLGLYAAALTVYTGPDGASYVVRSAVSAVFLTSIGSAFLLARRRAGFPAAYRRAFGILAVGYVLAAIAMAGGTLAGAARLPAGLAIVNLVAYVVCVIGVLYLPRRPLLRPDRLLLATDALAAAVTTALLATVLLQLAALPATMVLAAKVLLVIQGLTVLILFVATNRLALRAVPLPDRDTIQYAVVGLCLVLGAQMAMLPVALELLQDRRLADLLYAGFLGFTTVAAWRFARAPITSEPTTEAVPQLLLRAGPVPILMLGASVTVLAWCLERDAHDSALLAAFALFASLLPFGARLQFFSETRLAAADADLAERDARLAAMTRLAGGFAHELNNTLTTILNAAELARTAPTTEAREADLAELKAAARRAAQLARLTLAASGRTTGQPSATTLGPLIAEAAELAREELGPRWTLRTEVPEPDLVCRTDPRQLADLVRLLVRIIRGALPNGGELVVHVDRLRLDAPLPTVTVTVPPGEHVVVRVATEDAPRLPDATELFALSLPGEEQLAFDLTVARGLALSLESGLQLHARRGRGAVASVMLPLAEA